MIERCVLAFGSDMQGVMSRSRTRRNVEARRAICWILDRAGYGKRESGLFLGRHHASVIHHVRQADDLMSVDEGYRMQMTAITSALCREFNLPLRLLNP